MAGPASTIDLATPDGAAIEIEERDGDEVRAVLGTPITVPGAQVRNPAFDVTPAPLITALVTDRGIAEPVTPTTVAALIAAPPPAERRIVVPEQDAGQ